MVGFALSGVVLALWRDALARHGNRLLAVLPALLILAGALGYHLHHDQPVQSAAVAEPGDLAAAAWLHRAAITPACCRSSSWPGCSSA